MQVSKQLIFQSWDSEAADRKFNEPYEFDFYCWCFALPVHVILGFCLEVCDAHLRLLSLLW